MLVKNYNKYIKKERFSQGITSGLPLFVKKTVYKKIAFQSRHYRRRCRRLLKKPKNQAEKDQTPAFRKNKNAAEREN